MEPDWDLHAVVRGCAAASTTTTSAATSLLCSFESRLQNEDLLCSQDLPSDLNSSINYNASRFNEELHALYLPFLRRHTPPSEQPLPPRNPPVAVVGEFHDLPPKQPLKQPQLNISTTSNSRAQTPTGNRRKNQMKRLCHVPAEDLASDVWSWRKYGQKPIKGSPYPRGYYRCSTSKGCLARKQVERNRSDPNMFIVTYTAEHNHPMPTHRNSLAGSTRQKAAAPQSTTTSGSDLTNKPSSSPPVSFPTASCLSPPPEKDEVFEDEDEEFGLPDVAMNGNAPGDDFFEGLAELGACTSDDTGDSFSDNFPATMQFHWLANNATTTAAGGG